MNIPAGAVKESAVNAGKKPHAHHIFAKQNYPATSCGSAGVFAEKNGRKYANFTLKEGSES